jgi:hypothetical protein
MVIVNDKISTDLRFMWDDGTLGPVAQSWHIRKAMGLNPGRLPEEAVESRYVGDTRVYVLSREAAELEHPNSNKPHRMMAVCNHCGDHVPTGRFGQHLKTHNHRKIQGSESGLSLNL